MGRYVPPEHEGSKSGNQLHKKTSKPGGVMTVRFEMPFAVWCGHCTSPTIIGQGVRFNAVKNRVGSYLSSPIFSFRMRHAACGGELELRTDPQNTAYVVVSGGRKRDTGDDDDSLVKQGYPNPIVTDKERQSMRDSAFAKLEKTIEDRAVLHAAKERIGELRDVAVRQWDDPYARNQRLRRAFREGRKTREKDAAKAEDLKDRLSLAIDLLPEKEEDAIRASLVDFGAIQEDNGVGQADKALAKPLFDGASSSTREAESTRELVKASKGRNTASTSSKGKRQQKTRENGKLRAEAAATKMRESLVSEIVGNTRAAQDPFLDFGNNREKERDKATLRLPGLKRKRPSEDGGPGPPPERETPLPLLPLPKAAVNSLVSYDSD